MNARPLRVGLLVDASTVPAWIARAVQDVRASEVARLEVVILTPPAPREETALLYRLYRRLDARKFAPAPDPHAPVALAPLVHGVPIERITPRMTADGAELADTDLARLAPHALDVILDAGDRPWRGDVLGVARHGLWAYRHGDPETMRGGPTGFWEVMEGRDATGTVLMRLDDSPDGGRVLYRSFSTTHPISVRANLADDWKSSTFVLRVLRALHRDGADALTEPGPPAAYAGRRYTTPGNARMAALLPRLAARYVVRFVRERLQSRDWTLAYHLGAPADKEPMPDLVPHRFRELMPPPGDVWADPFPVHADGRHHVFFEECPAATRRGRIAVMTIDADGSTSTPVPVLERDYHLSYPFVFEWHGAHYMLPESSANRTLDLYRATRFPYEWTLDRTLLTGMAVLDATLAEIAGRWWMFANRPALDDAPYESCYWDELHLFAAESPLGPWTPHRRNPVVSDVRRARPAGRLFQRDGTWYRPAQNCAGRYGAALSIQRITRIDDDAYEETPVAALTPSWRPGISGVHTINAAGGLTVIDVAVQRSPRLFTPRRAASSPRGRPCTPSPRARAARAPGGAG